MEGCILSSVTVDMGTIYWPWNLNNLDLFRFLLMASSAAEPQYS
jgi:hypothetical protein